jgi:hypothetical protein
MIQAIIQLGTFSMRNAADNRCACSSIALPVDNAVARLQTRNSLRLTDWTQLSSANQPLVMPDTLRRAEGIATDWFRPRQLEIVSQCLDNTVHSINQTILFGCRELKQLIGFLSP